MMCRTRSIAYGRAARRTVRVGGAVRHAAAVGLLALVWGTGAQSVWDVWIALRDDVPLYREHRIFATLKKGEFVYGQRNSTYSSWINVRYHGNECHARTWHLRSWDAVVANRRLRIAELEDAIARSSDRIEEARQRAADLYAAAQSILYDSTIQYITRRLEPVPAETEGQTGAVRVVVSVVDRVDTSRARNLSRRWLREVDDLDDRVVRLQRQRRDAIEQRARLEALLALDQSRLSAFRTGTDSLADYYVCLRDRTPVYEGKRLKTELLRDTVVFAAPNRSYEGWLRVRIGKGWYDARAEQFLAKRKEIMDFACFEARSKRLLADYEERRDALKQRRELLRSLSLSLRYRYNVRSVPSVGSAAILTYEPNRRGLYTIVGCPAGAEVGVDAARARSRIRNWDGEADALSQEIDALRKQATKVRRDLETRRSRHERLLRLFQSAAMPAGG